MTPTKHEERAVLFAIAELFVLRCQLATHNKQISKVPCVSLFQIFSAVFLPLFELVHSCKSYNKNSKGELFIETQCTIGLCNF